MNPIEEFEDIRQHKLERCGDYTTTPKLLDCLPHNIWEKNYIAAGDLMEDSNLQIRVSNEYTWSYEIWDRAGTAQINEIGKNWETIKSYLPNTEYIKKHVSSIGPELTNLVLYNRTEETGVEFPLYITDNDLLLPLNSGSIVDGNHRLISILNSLTKGEIQESAPVPIWDTKIPNITVFGYNMLALFRLQMPLEKKLKLIEERILVGKKK